MNCRNMHSRLRFAAALLAGFAAGPAAAAGTGLIFVSNEKSDSITVLQPVGAICMIEQIVTIDKAEADTLLAKR